MPFAFNFGRKEDQEKTVAVSEESGGTAAAAAPGRELPFRKFVLAEDDGRRDSSERDQVIEDAFVETIAFLDNTRIRALDTTQLEIDASHRAAQAHQPAVAETPEAAAATDHPAQHSRGTLEKTDEDSIGSSVRTQSDLIPGVYEGGLKVWECAADLSNYLIAHGGSVEGLRVLEIGCGTGYPGLVAMRRGARVDFQDYNADVLSKVTMPNVFLNMSDEDEEEEEHPHEQDQREAEEAKRQKQHQHRQNQEEAESTPASGAQGTLESSSLPAAKRARGQPNSLAPNYTPRFFAGDWGSLDAVMGCAEEDKYDLLLTSETIYSPASMGRLYAFIKSRLRRPSGRVLLAAKTYYFGVGGGTRQFEALLRSEGLLSSRVVFVWPTGVKREILELRFA